MNTPDEMAPAQALAWINENVARGKERIQAARKSLDDLVKRKAEKPLSEDGFDYNEAIAAAQSHLEFEENQHFKWLGKQQLFDKSVDVSKRDSSESITRAEGARCFSMFAIYMRTACESYLTRIIPEIRESKSNEDAYAMTQESLREALVNSMASAVRETHLPAWSREAVESVL